MFTSNKELQIVSRTDQMQSHDISKPILPQIESKLQAQTTSSHTLLAKTSECIRCSFKTQIKFTPDIRHANNKTVSLHTCREIQCLTDTLNAIMVRRYLEMRLPKTLHTHREISVNKLNEQYNMPETEVANKNT